MLRMPLLSPKPAKSKNNYYPFLFDLALTWRIKTSFEHKKIEWYFCWDLAGYCTQAGVYLQSILKVTVFIILKCNENYYSVLSVLPSL